MRKIVSLSFIFLFMLASAAWAQERTVTGQVTSSEDGLGIPGASVVVQGTTIGTVTDFDGNYSLQVPSLDEVLVFSFVGLQTREIPIDGRTEIDVELMPDLLRVEEVVITGVAGATPRRKLSVTVDRVGTEQLEALPSTSASTALQGRLSGVTVVQSSGNPGQAANIRLRGSTNLLGDSNPLIIIDGVMMEGNLADVNMDDIESIEVVKGAAASALYGSRAGAGVINITSKRGNVAREGTTSVRVRNEIGFSELPSKIDLAESHPYELADDWQSYNKFTKYQGVTYPEGYEGGRNTEIAGNKRVEFDGYADNPFAVYYDHQDRIFQDGTYFTNYAGVAHNTGQTAIFTSFENTNNSGIVWGTEGSSRQNWRLNADHWFGDNLSLSSSTFVSQNVIDVADGRFTSGWGGGQGSAFFDMLFFEPDTNLDLDAPEGTLLEKYRIHPNHFQTDNGNPLHALYYQDRNLERKILQQSFQGNYFATDWLTFNAAYSLERLNTLNERFRPKGFFTSQQETLGGIYKSSSEVLSQTNSFTANINRAIGDLIVKGKLSYMYEGYNSKFFSVNAADLSVSRINTLNAISGDKTVSSSEVNIRSRNYFAILDMDYLDRYIVSGLFRMDGSSLFGEEHRWNPYYRFSAAYRISEDLQVPGIDEFRIRAAYGTSGQRPGFSYQYETYSISQGFVSKSTIGNTALRPSETKELELGLNMELFGMFDLEVTYADIITEGAFLNVPLPAATGFSYQWQNAADISATAIEATLGIVPFNTENLSWRMNFNFDKITQEVTRLDAAPFRVGPTINDLQVFYIREGEVFGTMYGGDWVRTLAEMEKQLPAGASIDDYVVNADGYVIVKGTEGTINEAAIRLLDEEGEDSFDKIADMNPDFNLSWLNSFNFSNFSLNMLWHWKQGGDVYNQTKQWLFRDERHGEFDQAGKPANEKKVATYYQTFYRVNEPNSYFVEDGTFLKLRELSLFYTLQRPALANMGLNFLGGVKLGIIGRNLYTLTNYSGWDPEVSQVDYGQSNSTNYYIDMFNYPNYRTLTFSVELNF
ncbi:MAG: SusC/RagA family TonB-linked outer membrane protein [Bacteroidales bacterium]